jgi:plastocyanin
MHANILRAAGLALLLAANAARADDAQVTIKNFDFMPMSLTVGAGTTVTWTNKDGEPHTVIGESGLFRSGALDTGASYSFTFAKPGTYKYLCGIHPKMTAEIVVK